MTRFHVLGAEAVPAGDHQLRMEFSYDGGGFGKGGAVALYLDGGLAGEGRVEATVPMLFSLDETADVGADTGTTVSERYTPEGSRFTGRVDWVEIDVDEAAADEDHLISPEERLQIAMARQ
jgi:arylsulfatase